MPRVALIKNVPELVEGSWSFAFLWFMELVMCRVLADGFEPDVGAGVHNLASVQD